MEQSYTATARIALALAKAQAAFPSIPKDRTVKVKTRTGGEYTFSYAPLDTILACVRQPLAANGLAIIQQVVTDAQGVEQLRTSLLHESGESLHCDVPILVAQGENGAQAYGSAITYARRYGVTTLLCIAADEDDDGNAADGNSAQRVERPAKGKAKAPATITEAQQAELVELLERTNTAADGFAEWLGARSLSGIAADRFAFAKSALEKKARKMAEDAKPTEVAAQAEGGEA